MKKNGRITLIVLAESIIASLVVRIYVIVAHTDMRTGFLYHGEDLLCNIAYYGIIAASAIVAAVTARTGRKGSLDDFPPEEIGEVKAMIIGILTMGAGLCAAYEGIAEMHALTPTGFLIFADFLFAAVLVCISFLTIYKKKFTPLVGYSYSIIGVYCICRGMYCFMSRMAIVTVPEYLIECLSLIGMSVFFVLMGRFFSGNATRFTRKGMCFWGVGTASLVLSSGLGTLIASVAAPEEIRSRIVYSEAAAEQYRQASAGFDAYKMVVTPWINLVLGGLIVAAIIAAFAKPVKRSGE